VSDDYDSRPQGVSTPGSPSGRPFVSMHEGVEVWEDDICSCAAEPRWQSMWEDLSLSERGPEGGEQDRKNCSGQS
jgi:hypothetical protein